MWLPLIKHGSIHTAVLGSPSVSAGGGSFEKRHVGKKVVGVVICGFAAQLVGVMARLFVADAI